MLGRPYWTPAGDMRLWLNLLVESGRANASPRAIRESVRLQIDDGADALAGC